MSNTSTDVYIIREKEVFIQRANKQIVMNTLLIESLETLKESVSAFNGKMLTKRLQRAFEKNKNEHSWCSLVGKTFTIGFQGSERQVYIGNNFKGYLSMASTEIEFITNIKYQLDAIKSIEVINNTITYLENQSKRYKDCIENFDSYAEKSQQIEAAIKAYKDEVPNILQFQLTINSPYLV